MDSSQYMWNVLMFSVMISSVVCDTRYLLSSLDCKRLTVDQSGTTIKWSGAALSNCRIDISKDDYMDDQICVKMKSINLLKSSNGVTFGNSFSSTLKVWNRFSSSSDIPTCTSLSRPYIIINTVSSYFESFQLKVYSKDDDFSNIVHSAVVTVGAIVGIVIGVIVLIIIVIVVVVCCCCMKSRRSPGTVYRPPATTAAVVTNQHHMVTQGQPQGVYNYPPPQQMTGFPEQHPETGGHNTQPMTGYYAPQPQGLYAHPLELQRSTEKPPAYT